MSGKLKADTSVNSQWTLKQRQINHEYQTYISQVDEKTPPNEC